MTSASANPQPAADIAIVGAGIIGICAAAYLAEAGYKVTVFDRTGVCEETSSGNASAFAFSDVLPLAHKGMMKNLPRWLADPLGPLAIPPSYLPKLLPWLWRFWRAGSPRHYEASLAAQAGMMKLAEPEWMGLLDRSGTKSMLREDGSLELYESEAEFRRVAARLGGARPVCAFPTGMSRATNWQRCSPACRSNSSRRPSCPAGRRRTTRRFLARRSGPTQSGSAPSSSRAMSGSSCRRRKRVVIQLKQGRTIMARRLVIAAGAWSHLLARQLGDKIPLETERGYNTTLPVDAFDVKRQLIFSGHGFVITPLVSGLRIGGAVELGGLKLPPNYRALQGDAGEGATFPARPEDRGRPRMDGVSAVAAGFPAGDRPLEDRRQCVSMPSATAISARPRPQARRA